MKNKTITTISSIIIFIFLFASYASNAQDKIHMLNGTIVDTKVKEINETQIKYVKFSNQNGPIYTINISDVSLIIYENGVKEVYNAPKEPTNVTNTNVSTPINTSVENASANETNQAITQEQLKSPTAYSTNNTPGKKIYFNLGFGIVMNAASHDFNATMVSDTISIEGESVSGSLGKGMNSLLGIGLNLSKNIAIEIGANYLMGFSIKNTVTDNSFNPADVQTTTRKATMLRVIPAVVIKSGEDKLQAYAKFGLVIGMAGKITLDYERTQISTTEKTTEYSGRTAFGYVSSLGLCLGNKTVSYFCEMNMINLSWAPAKSILTKFDKNGSDQLSGLSTSQLETEYVDHFSSSYLTANPNNPTQSTKKYFPLSSFGINLGLRFAF